MPSPGLARDVQLSFLDLQRSPRALMKPLAFAFARAAPEQQAFTSQG